jgi:hypothetical protein
MTNHMTRGRRCLCGMAKPGDWTDGIHHGQYRCAKVVITRLKSNHQVAAGKLPALSRLGERQA